MIPTPQQNNRSRIVLFSKYPTPGKVKTRLIPEIGAQAAAQVQGEMLLKIVQEVTALLGNGDVELEIRFSGASPERFAALLGQSHRYVAQGDGDLGARMTRAVNRGFADGFSRVMLVGADIPLLDRGIIEEALMALQNNNVVIGPAEDGGYYLIGFSSPHVQLFEDVSWGSETVLATTQKKLKRENLSCHTLKELFDVDRPADLARWNSLRQNR